MTDAPTDNPNVLVLPPVLYAAGLVIGFPLQWLAPQPILSTDARYMAGC